MRKGLFILSGLLLVLAVTTGASGTIKRLVGSRASTATKITACVSKRTGLVRIAKTCTNAERRIVWNVQGPRGARGPAGGKGAAGPAGAKGATGAAGPAG